jgi:hypothetical protein
VSTPIAAALSNNSTPPPRLSAPTCGSSSKSRGNESGNASDVTCDFERSAAGGRRATVARCVVAWRDVVGAWRASDVTTVVTVVVLTTRGVAVRPLCVCTDETATGRLIAGAVGVETRGLTSACGAGSGDG